MDHVSCFSDPLIVALEVIRNYRGRRKHPKTVRELAVKNMATQKRAQLKQQLKKETDVSISLNMCTQLRHLPRYLTYLQTMWLEWAQKTLYRYQLGVLNGTQ